MHTIPEKQKLPVTALTVLSISAVFLISCCTIHIIHKHCPLKAASSVEYDASCHWVKTDKAEETAFDLASNIFLQALYIAAALYLFLICTFIADDKIPLKIFSPSSHATRAPPYFFSL
jgi:hypothetical protein